MSEPRLHLEPEGVQRPKPDRMLQFFRYEHLPPALAEASRPFCVLAEHVAAAYPMNPERTICLRKLLEAKDAAVRTYLFDKEGSDAS